VHEQEKKKNLLKMTEINVKDGKMAQNKRNTKKMKRKQNKKDKRKA
jgi:hypothetical protein